MIKTKQLLNVVALAMSGSKSMESNVKNHLFHGGYIFSYSRALSVLAKLPEGCEHLEGVIDSNILYKLLGKLKKDEIDIVVNKEEKKWTISSDTSTAEIQLNIDETLGERFDAMNPEDLEWHELPGKFYEGLTICDIPSNKFKLKGLYIQGDTMLSTDGKRFHRATLDSTIDEAFPSDAKSKALFISDYSVTELLRAGIKFGEFAVTDNWVYFRSSNEDEAVLLFACNRLDESSYMYDAIMKIYANVEGADGVEGTFPPILDSLDLAQVFDNTVTLSTNRGVAIENNNVISLTFGKNSITVSSERSAIGKYSNRIAYPDGKKLPIEESFKIQITGPFLKEALKHTKDFTLVDMGGKFVMLMKGEFFSTIINTI